MGEYGVGPIAYFSPSPEDGNVGMAGAMMQSMTLEELMFDTMTALEATFRPGKGEYILMWRASSGACDKFNGKLFFVAFVALMLSMTLG